jgi:hypothetical protein
VLGGIVPGIDHDIRAIALLGGTIYVGGVLRFPGSTRPAEATLARATQFVLSDHAGSANADDECMGCASVDAVIADGSSLYAAGAFTRLGQPTAVGSPYAAVRLAGATVSVGLGEGAMSPLVQAGGVVYALLMTEGDLYAAGSFVEWRGIAAGNVARWSGGGWTSPGGGVSGPVRALAAWDGAVFAGGIFLMAAGTTVNHIARWDGTAWQPLTTVATPVKSTTWGALKNTYR